METLAQDRRKGARRAPGRFGGRRAGDRAARALRAAECIAQELRELAPFLDPRAGLLDRSRALLRADVLGARAFRVAMMRT